jgi:hypothetical protein
LHGLKRASPERNKWVTCYGKLMMWHLIQRIIASAPTKSGFKALWGDDPIGPVQFTEINRQIVPGTFLLI